MNIYFKIFKYYLISIAFNRTFNYSKINYKQTVYFKSFKLLRIRKLNTYLFKSINYL